MNILDAFQYDNPEHLAAYWRLIQKGSWPEDFWPETVVASIGWREVLNAEMAKRFLAMKLGEAVFTGECEIAHFEMVEDLLDAANDKRLREDIQQAEDESTSVGEWVDFCRTSFHRVFGTLESYRIATEKGRIIVVVQPTTWGTSEGYYPELAGPILKRFPDGFALDGATDGDHDAQVAMALSPAHVEFGL